MIPPSIKGKFLPDNPNHFDYLHAIRAIISQSGVDAKDNILGQILNLADEGMSKPIIGVKVIGT